MRLAALDIGSNTVLMLVVEVGADRKPIPLAERSRITRLGRGVDARGHLDPIAARQTLDTIVEFTAQARALGAEKIIAAATAALRDAADGAEFIAEISRRAGITPDIISGAAEAQLSYLSTRRGLGLEPARQLLIIDIGGGSTELIRAEAGEQLSVASLQIGSVRLTERLVRHDPPSAVELATLQSAAASALHGLGWVYRPEIMVGIAGTVTTLGAMALALERYSSAAVHGSRLGAERIDRIIECLSTTPLEERKRLRGMEPGRADVLLAGAVILQQAMVQFGVKEVIVSDQGVRWGLVWRELAGS